MTSIGRLSGHARQRLSGDPRVVRTRALLKQALLGLLRENDWGEITVASLCRRAGVARSSFYEHFTVKAEVLDDLFVEKLAEIEISADAGPRLATLDWLVDHANEAPDFFAGAMAGRRGDALAPRFVAALARRLEQELSARGIPEAMPKAAFVIGGAVAYLLATKDADPGTQLQRLAARLL